MSPSVLRVRSLLIYSGVRKPTRWSTVLAGDPAAQADFHWGSGAATKKLLQVSGNRGQGARAAVATGRASAVGCVSSDAVGNPPAAQEAALRAHGSTCRRVLLIACCHNALQLACPNKAKEHFAALLDLHTPRTTTLPAFELLLRTLLAWA